jgi:hypothetical protein
MTFVGKCQGKVLLNAVCTKIAPGLLQASLGWSDSHLHQFIVGGLVFGAPEFDDGHA